MHIIRFSANDFFAVRNCENMRIRQSALMSQRWSDKAGFWCGKQAIRRILGFIYRPFYFLAFTTVWYCTIKSWALYLTHYACKCWALYAVHIFVLDFCPRRVYWILYIDHFFVFLFFLISLGFIYRPYCACWLGSWAIFATHSPISAI